MRLYSFIVTVWGIANAAWLGFLIGSPDWSLPLGIVAHVVIVIFAITELHIVIPRRLRARDRSAVGQAS